MNNICSYINVAHFVQTPLINQAPVQLLKAALHRDVTLFIAVSSVFVRNNGTQTGLQLKVNSNPGDLVTEVEETRDLDTVGNMNCSRLVA